MIIAKKSLGQNFLIDEKILKKITDLTEIEDKTILEIGPGTGNLSSYILEKNPKKFFVVEKDHRLISSLQEKFQNQIQIINEDILNIDGIGETQVSSIKSFFSNKINKKVVNELEKILLIKDFVQNSDGGLLNNKTFLVTGKLNGISRAEVKSLIEENSGKTISSVSKKLNFLIVGEKPTKKKVDYAKQFKIKVIGQAEFLKMLNKSS